MVYFSTKEQISFVTLYKNVYIIAIENIRIIISSSSLPIKPPKIVIFLAF